MMARSTPAALLHSIGGRAAARLLEASFLVLALALAVMLLVLHAKFVRDNGCAPLISSALRTDLRNASDASQSRVENHKVQDHVKIVELVPLAPAPWPLLVLLRTLGSVSSSAPDLANAADRHVCDEPGQVASCPVEHHGTTNRLFRFRFARERGVLLLSDNALKDLNISIHTVFLRPRERCLGGKWISSFLAKAVGYHAVAANAFLAAGSPSPSAYMSSLSDGRLALSGFLRAYPTKTIINLSHAAAAPVRLRLVWKFGALITAIFIMCTTSALVSFTLKEVQVRIVKLSIDLQYAMRSPESERSYCRVLLRYALDALVFVPIVAGELFFLFEFFDDQPLAFAVLVVSWLAEVAVNGSTRHWVSRSYLPRLFFVYFGAFHFYFFSFPLGFTWLSFTTSVVLMFHACLAIWNHFELPLMQQEAEARSEWT